jgi:hypothetical protein
LIAAPTASFVRWCRGAARRMIENRCVSGTEQFIDMAAWDACAEALKRRAAGETLASIAKSYAVDISMISRLN